jgi:hypothetical protein
MLEYLVANQKYSYTRWQKNLNNKQQVTNNN